MSGPMAVNDVLEWGRAVMNHLRHQTTGFHVLAADSTAFQDAGTSAYSNISRRKHSKWNSAPRMEISTGLGE